MKAYVVTAVRDADAPILVRQIGEDERDLEVRGPTLADAADAILRAHTGEVWGIGDVAAMAAMLFGPVGRERSFAVTIRSAQIDRFVQAARGAAC